MAATSVKLDLLRTSLADEVGNTRKGQRCVAWIFSALVFTTCLTCSLSATTQADESHKLINQDAFSIGRTVQLSGLMGDTAKRAVESTNVPQLMTTLRGRVELAEERLNNMADKSFRALEDELTGVRAEVHRLSEYWLEIRWQKCAVLVKAYFLKTVEE